MIHDQVFMKYNKNYDIIFAILDDRITEAVEFISHNIAIGRHLSLRYLCLIAEYITAYNELSNLSFFVKTTHFKPNN